MSKSIGQLFAEYLGECNYAGKLRPQTLKGYRACFNLLMKVYPDLQLDELSPERMVDFFRRLETRERVVGRQLIATGIKNSTVATYRNKLDKFFKWMRERGYIKNDPFLGVPYPEVNYSDRKFLSRVDIIKIFNAANFGIAWQSPFLKSRNVAIMSVLMHCGLRKGEVVGLQLADIDIERRELRVRAATSKSKRERYVPLNTAVLTALKEYLNVRRMRNSSSLGLWLANGVDSDLTMNGFKHLMVQLAKVSGVNFHPHQFRHTFAVNLLNSGTDIYKLRQLLGHLDIRMTAAYLRGLPTKSLGDNVERLALMNDLL